MFTKLRRTKRDYASIFTALIIFMPILNYYLNYIIQAYVEVSISMVVYIVLFVLCVASYFYAVSRSKLPFLLLGITGIIFLFTLSIFPQNTKYMFTELLDAAYNPLYRLVFLGMPLMFLPSLIKNSAEICRWMEALSRITILIALFAYLFIVVGQGKQFEYMTFSYQLLLPLCVCFIFAIKKKQILWIIIDIIGFVCVIAMGSRGAMISVILFFAIYAFFSVYQKPTVAKVIALICAFVAIIVLMLNAEAIAKWLYELLAARGFESRSLEAFLSGSILDDSGRTEIIDAVVDGIWKSPFIGNGIYGDMCVTEEALGTGIYAHNILLELLCQYGIFVGGVIGLLYLFFSIKTLFNRRSDRKLYYIYFATFAACFFKLFITNSYLSEQLFFLLIGLIICLEKNKGEGVYEQVR